MARNPKTYNPRVFYVEDPNQRDQCQFVYEPQPGQEKPTRCPRDGIYRIGLVVFFCGIHMPGVGRHPETNPVKVEKVQKVILAPGMTMQDKIFAFFKANRGAVITYDQMMKVFPNIDNQQYLSIAVCRLRKKRNAQIQNVPHVGYLYKG